MHHFTQQVLARLPIHRLCPVCNIELSSPIVALSHYKGVKHIKKEQQNNTDLETRSKIAEFGKKVKLQRHIYFALVNKGVSLKDKSWSDGGFNRRMEQERHNKRMRVQREEKQKAWDARQEIERKRKLPTRKSSLKFENYSLKFPLKID